YHFRLVVAMASRTYSAYVTPVGGAEQAIGTGYAFRTEQSGATSLANQGAYTSTGSFSLCNFTLTTGGGTVTTVASVSVTPATASLAAGNTVQLTGVAKDAAGNTLSGQSFGWSSNNTSVATVSASGLVTSVTAGSATITATSGGLTGTSAVTVTAPAPATVASVSVTPTTYTVASRGTVQLAAVARDAGGNTL